MAQFRKDTHQFLGDSKTIFETVMLADQYGNIVGAANPTGMAVDAFGKARVGNPFTLFESFHRYQDNGKISQSNSATGASSTFNANGGCIDCTIDNASGSFLYRESTRTFNYQPGKSLQILQTFTMAAPKTGLRQRYGYFGAQNGFFLEQDGTTVSLVKRSYVTGSVVDTKVSQANWNVDKMDGTGPSLLTLDLTKSQILFTDIEWLGVGSVRQGFIINGKLIPVHTWNHANIITGAYMTTACLPVRAEIENTAATSGSSTLKIICASVISEGGIEPRGRVKSYAMPLASSKNLPTAGTFTPVLSIRLKDAKMDAIALIRSISFFGVTNNTSYIWKVTVGGTLTGASWVSYAEDSPIEYDVTASAVSGGTDIRNEYINVSSGSGAASAQIPATDIYKYQLERNSFLANNKGIAYTISATGASNDDDGLASIQWEEIT